MRDKKAQGLSINIIVVAAIALLVMVILIGLFASKIGMFGREGESCTSKGGTCKPEPCGVGWVPISAKGCPTNQKCCIALNPDCNDIQGANCMEDCGSREEIPNAVCDGGQSCCR